MKKLLFFLICCAVPITADAANIFNFNDSFNIAKAVKLGRGSAYSVNASSNLNPGGQISDKKSCSTGCTSCDTSTGTCSGCSGGYYLSGGTCVACSTIPVRNGTCAYCMGDEDYVSCERAECNTGYFDDYGSCESCSYTIDNCAECDSTGSTCTKCNSGYTLADDGKSCLGSSVTVKRYHRYNGSKILDTSTTISRSTISSYYDSWPDVDIYDEDNNSGVTETTNTIAMVCSSGVGEFWTMSACQQYKKSGYYCADSGYSCPYETRLCAIDNCMECDSEGLCSTCESGYTVGTSGSDYGKCIADGETCPAGYYMRTTTTSSGSNIAGSNVSTGSSTQSCVPCAAGYYSEAGATSCTSCPTGYYSEEGSASCSICAAGYYKNGTSCVQCPAGTYSAAGATSCTNCPTGYTSNAGAASCTICADGYKSAGSYGCVTCPSGQDFIIWRLGGGGYCIKLGSTSEGYGCNTNSSCSTGFCYGADTYKNDTGKTAYPSYAGGSVCGPIGSNISF